MFLDVIDPVVDESEGFNFGAGVLPVIIIVSVIVVLILSTVFAIKSHKNIDAGKEDVKEQGQDVEMLAAVKTDSAIDSSGEQEEMTDENTAD